MMENIKELHKKIPMEDRSDFYQAVADDLGVSKSTVRINYFYRFEIRKQFIPRVLELTQNQVKLSN